MKVYVVTTGEYSSYHIEGVFSTPEKADEYSKSAGGFGYEEWEVDELPPLVYGPMWHKKLDFDGREMPSESGRYVPAGPAVFHENWEITKHHYASIRGYGYAHQGLWEEKDLQEFLSRYGNRYGCFEGVSYVSEEHAMKLAVEMRQAYLRGEWRGNPSGATYEEKFLKLDIRGE